MNNKCPKCGRPNTQNIIHGCKEFDPFTGKYTKNILCLGCLTEYKEVK